MGCGKVREAGCTFNEKNNRINGKLKMQNMLIKVNVKKFINVLVSYYKYFGM